MKTIRSLLILILAASPSLSHAFACLCESPFFAQIAQATSQTASNTAQTTAAARQTASNVATVNGTLNSQLTKVNQALVAIQGELNGVSAQTEKVAHQNTEAIQAQTKVTGVRMINETKRRVQAEAQSRRFSMIDTQSCTIANSREGLGRGQRNQGYASRRMMSRSYSNTRSVRSNREAVDQLIARQATGNGASLVPTALGNPEGTLDETELTAQSDFINNIINPVPPVAPENLPTVYKRQEAAKDYAAIYEVNNSMLTYLNRVASRELELKSGAVKAPDAFFTDWKEVTGNLPAATPVVIKTPRGDVTLPDRRAELTPVIVNGTKYVSEMDYMRGSVYRWYANPNMDAKLLAGGPDYVMKQIFEQQVLTNRLLLEIVQNTQNSATIAAFNTADQARTTLGNRLAGLVERMRGVQ